MTAMPNGTPYKICPKCQTAAPMDAPQCLQCGRMYRTKFVMPANTTQVFTTPYIPANIQYPAGQAMPAQTQKPTGKKNWLLGCLGGCVGLPIALLMALSILGSLVPKKTVVPPGPKAQALAQEIRNYTLFAPEDVLNRYGVPDNTIRDRIGGVDYFVFMYKTQDGTVQVRVNRPLWIVERVSAYGK